MATIASVAVSVLCGLIGLLSFSALFRAFFFPPWRHPLFVRKRKEHVLVATGASATHGTASYDWVSALDRRLSKDGWSCLNLAWNGRRAGDVLSWLGSVIAQKPEVVIVMVGVNDVNMFTPVDAYRACLVAIVDRLQRETSARIGLCTLTAIGDDVEGFSMRRSVEFNDAVREVARERGVGCIDVAAAQREWLEKRGKRAFWPVALFLPLMMSSIWMHYALFFPWNWISRVHGLGLTTDLVHQNAIGGAIITDLVERFVRER